MSCISLFLLFVCDCLNFIAILSSQFNVYGLFVTVCIEFLSVTIFFAVIPYSYVPNLPVAPASYDSPPESDPA